MATAKTATTTGGVSLKGKRRRSTSCSTVRVTDIVPVKRIKKTEDDKPIPTFVISLTDFTGWKQVRLDQQQQQEGAGAPPPLSPTVVPPIICIHDPLKTYKPSDVVAYLKECGCVDPYFYKSYVSNKDQSSWHSRIVNDTPLVKGEFQHEVRRGNSVVSICVYSEEWSNEKRFKNHHMVKRWPRWLTHLNDLISGIAKTNFNHLIVERYPFAHSLSRRPRIIQLQEGEDSFDPCGTISAPRCIDTKIAILVLGNDRAFKFESVNPAHHRDSPGFRLEGGDLFLFDSSSFPNAFRIRALPSLKGAKESIVVLTFECRIFHPLK